MSIPLIVNGVTFDYPEVDDVDWGPEATDWAAAVTSGMLQKSGGLFQLLAEADFGTAFGVKSLYFKTRTANPSATGQFRLAKTDGVYWRNNANDGDLALTLDGSDNLTFNGAPLGGIVVVDTDSIDLTYTAANLSADLNLSADAAGAGFLKITNSIESDGLLSLIPEASGADTGALTSTDWTTFNSKQAAGAYITALTGDVVAAGPGSSAAAIQAGVIVNAMVSASAAIAYSKLNLADSIVNADINSAAAIAYSKLNLSGSIVNADVNAAAAIAYSKLNLSGAIVNADVSASAAIAFSKLAALTSANILVGSAGNVATSVAVTGAISITNAGLTAYSGTVPLNKGGTGQTTKAAAFDALSPMSASGDLIYGATAGTGTALVKGTDGQILTLDSGLPAWKDGAGSGGINYAAALYPGTTISGIATYNDGAASTPTNGTGGVVTGLTTALLAVNPLRPPSNQRFSKDGSNRQGEGWSWDFTVNRADYLGAQLINISFNYVVSGGYVNNDVRVFVYDVDNSVLLNVISLTGDGSVGYSATPTGYTASFNLASTASNYRLIWHIAGTTAAAWDFDLINIVVSPQQTVPGAIITSWQSYTPTFTGFGTVNTQAFYWRRVGDTVQIHGRFVPGTTTATEARISLPAGTTAASTITTLEKAGTVIKNTGAATTTFAFYTLMEPSVTYLTLGYQLAATAALAKQNGNVWATSGDIISLDATVPIASWAASAALSTTEIQSMGAFLSASGDAASATAGNPIIVPTKVYDTLNCYSVSTGLFTVPRTGKYRIHGASKSSSGGGIALQAYVNSVNTELVGYTDSNGEATFSGTVQANAGATISLRPDATYNAESIYLHIEEVFDPTIFATYTAGNNYRSVTTTDSASIGDNILSFSGASFTETLPSAIGCPGKQFTLIHNGTSLSQVYTLNTTSAQTIGGIASGSYALYTNGEVLVIASDGANWQILDHKAVTEWVSAGVITITATTTSPTKPSGITVDRFLWRRDGRSLKGRFEYKQSNTTSANNGSGDYLLLAVPSGATIDTTWVTAYTTVIGFGGMPNTPSAVGSAFFANSSTTGASGVVSVYDTTKVRLALVLASTASTCNTGVFGSSNSLFTNAATTAFSAEFELPITGWQP